MIVAQIKLISGKQGSALSSTVELLLENGEISIRLYNAI